MKHNKRNITLSSICMGLASAFWALCSMPWTSNGFYEWSDYYSTVNYYDCFNINGYIVEGIVWVITVILFVFSLLITNHKITFSKKIRIMLLVLLSVIIFFELEVFIFDTCWVFSYWWGALEGYYVLAIIELAIMTLCIFNLIFVIKETAISVYEENPEVKYGKDAKKNDMKKESTNLDIAYEALSKLKQLHDEGILTDEEYQEKRKKYVDVI